jgi:hypothetical protein
LRPSWFRMLNVATALGCIQAVGALPLGGWGQGGVCGEP